MKYLSIFLFILPLAFTSSAQTEIYIVGVVQTPTHEPLSNVEVRIIGGGRDLTTTSGEFRIKLSASRVGQRVVLQVTKRGWTIANPNELQVIVPADSVQNPIRIRMKMAGTINSPASKTSGKSTRGNRRAETKKNKSNLGIKTNGSHSNKLVVLVADFKSIGERSNAVTETIISQLRAATKEYSDIDVQALGEEITPQQGSGVALAKAHERKAFIILWGWYSKSKEKVLVNANFEVLRKPRDLDLKQGSQLLLLPLSDIDSFSIQIRLSNEMSYLTLLTTGLARLDAEDYDGALDRFTKALNLPNVPDQMIDSSDLYCFRGRARLNKFRYSFRLQEDLDKAITDLDQSIKINDKNAKALISLGSAHQDKNDLELAIKLSIRAAEAARNLDEKLAAYLQLGYVYLEKGERDKAVAVMEQASVISHELPAPFSLFFPAVAMCLVEDYDRCLANLNQAIRSYTNPDRETLGMLFLMRGVCYFIKNDKDKALSDADMALKISSRYPKVYIVRGLFYEDSGDYNQAILNYTNAINIDTKSTQAYKARADAYVRMRDYDKAVADYTAIIKLSPHDFHSYVERGHSYEYKGDLDKALYDYDYAIKLHPDAHYQYLDRGHMYDRKGDMKKALSDYNQAIKLKLDYETAYFRRAYLYERNGDLDAAIADLTECIRLKPEKADTHLYRGLNYAKKNEHDLAITDLKKAIELTDDLEIRLRAKQKLRELEQK